MRNCNKVITVRLTEAEYHRCEVMARGNKSFYVRQLIQNDIKNSDTLAKDNIIKIVEDYLAKEKIKDKPLTLAKPEHTKTAKQVISDIFNF